ncbi:MAG: ATPase, T2SS/T4P/T4SS family, partial [Alphaproteobacteria bacterium]|nr:ATPase, T2SS/T4P/T4SS family [Alphaproteobacteria bacterium]
MDGAPKKSGHGASYLEHYLSNFAGLLSDPATVEIAINPDRSVWALKRGDVHMQRLDAKVEPGYALRLAQQIAGSNQTQVGRDKLLVSATVEYHGRPIRAQCVLNPAAAGDGALSFRLFASLPLDEIKLSYLHGKPLSLSEMRRERNTKLKEIMGRGGLDEALEFCVAEKLNVVISGGTDTGKSVALRKIISMVPAEERIITIEDAPELFPTQPNTVSLIADRFGSTRTTDQLLEATLRMRPDRIIVGEVRGKEAMTFLEAINTG